MNNIKDDSLNPNFVRVELLPKDGDIFNHSIKNWNLKVDQDLIPDWFDKEKVERACKSAIKKVFKERFLIGKNVDEIKGNLRGVKDSHIKYVGGNAVLKVVRGNAVLEDVGGNAVIQTFCEKPNIKSIKDLAMCIAYLGGDKIKIISSAKIIKTKPSKQGG